MKSLFKVTLLATTVAFALGATQVMAADDTKTAAVAAKPAEAAPSAAKFKSDDEQAAYALGASLGRYMENSLNEQEKLGIKLDKAQLIAGVQDALANQSKLSDADIGKSLQDFEVRVQAKIEQDGAKFAEAFAKEKGVKKTESGLLYKVEKEGTGDALKDSDTVVVNYKGALYDGRVFDSSYDRGEPVTLRLDSVIPGWTEGLKHVKKGGKIKLVIPPALAYGKAGIPGTIPPNATLVFDVELMDVKPAAKAEAKAEKAADAAADSKANDEAPTDTKAQ